MIRKHPTMIGIGAVCAVTALGTSVAVAADQTGRSSSETPYLVSLEKGAKVTSIMTVGDAAPNGYRMVGIPDGLGAYDNGDDTFTVVMNHELRSDLGVERDHGYQGAFISKWRIAKGSLEVLDGEDLIQDLYLWNGSGYDLADDPSQPGAINRLCSADLPPLSAFYDESTGKGYPHRIFMNGEEAGSEGRAFAHIVDGPEAGDSYELPYLGKFSWENSVTHPDAGDKTIVIGLDDSGNGQLYVYVGEKQATGSAVERAGLAYGNLYAVEDNGDGTFGLLDVTSFALGSGAALDAAGGTAFNRPEDGAWNPNDLNQFVFATTASFTGNSELFSMVFEDAANPTLGGTIEVLADSSDGPRMMDNLTINDRNQVLVQEDPGGNEYLSGIWRYDMASDEIVKVFEHDADRFATGGPDFLTTNEESSGIIPMAGILGEGYYLADVQAHYSVGDPELVEGGQLVLLQLAPGKANGRSK